MKKEKADYSIPTDSFGRMMKRKELWAELEMIKREYYRLSKEINVIEKQKNKLEEKIAYNRNYAQAIAEIDLQVEYDSLIKLGL